jgi:hypothetical protein
MKGLTTQRLIALFGTFALVLQYPLLRLSDKAERVAGIPVLYLHVLLGWLLLIVLMAWVMHDKQRRERTE